MAKMFETEHVVIYVGEPGRENEVVTFGKDSFRDAVKYIQVGPHEQPVLAVYGVGMKRPGTEVFDEIGWIKFAHDERLRGQWDRPQGEIEVFVSRHAPALGNDDAQRVRKVRIRWDGIEFFDHTGRNVIWSTQALGDGVGGGVPAGEGEEVHDGSPGPVGEDGPILDVNIVNKHNRYHVYVARGQELDAVIADRYRVFTGHEPGGGDLRHARWRVVSEAGTWGTLRGALDNMWPV